MAGDEAAIGRFAELGEFRLAGRRAPGASRVEAATAGQGAQLGR